MGLFGRDEKTSQKDAADQPGAGPRTAPTAARQPARVTVVAGPNLVEGSLTGSGDVTVEGGLKGTIRTEADVLIAETGSVEADVHGRSVVVAGAIKGNVTADERIELRPSARLRGNITAPRILIQDGATFEGKVEMKRPPQTGKPAGTPDSGKPSPSEKGDEARSTPPTTATSSARREATDQPSKKKS